MASSSSSSLHVILLLCCQNCDRIVKMMEFSYIIRQSNHSFCFSSPEHAPFHFGRSVNILYLSPGGASAHSHRQPKEAGSSALLRPRQNPGQQCSKHGLWAWGHEPARWDKALDMYNRLCISVCVSCAGAHENRIAPIRLLSEACENFIYSDLEGLWNCSITMCRPHNDGQTMMFLTHTVTAAGLLLFKGYRPDKQPRAAVMNYDKGRCCTCGPLCVVVEKLALSIITCLCISSPNHLTCAWLSFLPDQNQPAT